MARSATMFLLAATSLAAALWWSPGAPRVETALPPPPPPPLVPVTTVPRVSYSDEILTIEARTDREAVLAETPTELFVDLTVKATDAVTARSGIATLLVIDRSGSMAGEAIEQVRLATLRLLHGLDDRDRFALVSYGSDVSVDVPWTRATTPGKTDISARVSAVVEGGGTHLDAGLRKAVSMVEQLSAFEGPVRVILLSDGLANEGERRVERLATYGAQLASLGATLSTLGLGADFHAPLLGELATRGGGRYRFLAEADDLGRLFEDERRHAEAVVARDVTLHVEFAKGMQLIEVHGAAPVEEGAEVALRLGDLASGESRRVLLSLRVSGPLTSTAPVEVVPPSLTYRSTRMETRPRLSPADALRIKVVDDATQAAASRVGEVSARVTLVQQHAALGRSLADASPQGGHAALTALEEIATHLQRAAHEQRSQMLAEEARRTRAVIDQLRDASADTAKGTLILRREQARAFEQIRLHERERDRWK